MLDRRQGPKGRGLEQGSPRRGPSAARSSAKQPLARPRRFFLSGRRLLQMSFSEYLKKAMDQDRKARLRLA